MADKHPYISGVGNISQALNHFRNSFPSKVDAATLKKLGLAPNNESFLINILRFIKLISEDGTKTKETADIFSQHDDNKFREKFKPLIQSAYHDLFDLYGVKTWEIDLDSLITFFRSTDQTSSLIGKHQARTFKVLAAACGYGELPQETNAKKSKANSLKTTSKKEVANKAAKKEEATVESPLQNSPVDSDNQNSKVALTVRVEVNLPADGDQETYDRIFRSIRENLINGN
jgi:hypothetical protein